MEDFFKSDDIFMTILNYITEKINTPEINDKIQDELIKPITQLIIKHMYPYMVTTIVIIALMFLCIIGTFILMLKK